MTINFQLYENNKAEKKERGEESDGGGSGGVGGGGERAEKYIYFFNTIAIDRAIDITGVIGDVC